jgi:hypothetical protein
MPRALLDKLFLQFETVGVISSWNEDWRKIWNAYSICRIRLSWF